MSQCVCTGALIKCSFGTFPTPLNVLPQSRVMACKRPAANIMDFKPFVNIMPFGFCNAPTNPMVIAAKIVGSPAPCIPVPVSPWLVGAPTVLMGKMPALNSTSKTVCMWAGVIDIAFPGQVTVSVP